MDETEMDQPSDEFISDCDRSDHQHFPHRLSEPVSSKEAKKEPEPINGKIIGVTAPVAYGPSTRTERDRSPLRSFYTPTIDVASPSPPSSLSSSSSLKMPVITRHSNSDFTLPTPPIVAPADAPLLSPTAQPTVLCVPTEECLEAESIARSTVGSGQGAKSLAGKKSSKSVSRLCFPFVKTSPKRKDKDKDSKLPGMANLSVSVVGASGVSASAQSAVPSPPVPASSLPRLHNHSCSPTRFCPLSVKRAPPVQKRQRHAYANRGYSHEALEYVKSFWSVRHEGMNSSGGMDAMAVHSGTAHQAGPRPTTAAAPSTATPTDLSEEKGVPPSIHPRRGDISALRDSQCAEVDQSFGALGVWTITKMVWMIEVGVGVERLEREKEKEERRRRRSRLRMRILWDENESEDGDEGGLLLTRSTSTSSLSDDSDITLVGDESSSPFLLPSCLKEEDEDGRVGYISTHDTDEEDDEGLQLVIRGRKLTHSVYSTPSARTSATSSVSPGPGRALKSNMDLDKPTTDRSMPRSLYQTRVEASKLTGPIGCQLEWATDWASRWEAVKNLSQEKKRSGFYEASGSCNKLLASTPTSSATTNTNSKA